MPDELEKPDPRVLFAAERTLLAWVRTGLAMMGFGFVVARFGLFLRELVAIPDAPPRHASESLWIGIFLVLLGVVVNIWATVTHWQTVRRLEQNLPLHFSPLSLGTGISLLLAALGVLIASYLAFRL